jgi:hypothetical protein
MCDIRKKMRKWWGVIKNRVFLIYENDSLEKEWSDYSLDSNKSYLKFIFVVWFCI